MSAADVQGKVLSFITANGSAVIGDLESALPDVSRARIQVALAALLDLGSIARAGIRRGTVYALTLEAAEAARVERFARVRRAAKRAAKGEAKGEGRPAVEAIGEEAAT